MDIALEFVLIREIRVTLYCRKWPLAQTASFKSRFSSSIVKTQKFAGCPIASSFFHPSSFAGAAEKRAQTSFHEQPSIFAARKMPSMGRNAEPANNAWPG